jgi:DmsE family decaheme c-type cytochrome
LLVTLVAFAWSMSMAIHPTAAAASGAPGMATAGRETSEPRKGAQASGAKRPAQPAAAGQADEYVGQDTCLGCHETQAYTGTRHALASLPRSPAATHGCESCHGPGRAHVEEGDPTKIVNPSKLTPQRASEICATCHDRGSHAVWSGSQHDSRNVGCVTCHSQHSFKGPKQLNAATELAQCAMCHKDKIAKLDRSGHMPVREGKMQCTTCHNPHGSTNVRLLRRGDSIAELCTSCHADKRGPYLWEHAPTRDGCATCHDPHGSSNERMLVSKPPILCQRCHVSTRHPSTIYDAGLIGAGATPSIRVYARSCVTCHTMIHGSNHPSGQRFIR